MSNLHSTPTAVLTAILLASAVGFAVQYTSSIREVTRIATGSTTAAEISPGPAATTAPASAVTVKAATWAASAPGRIEPKGGEVRIGSQMPGRIADVLVQVNDKVTAGDLLVRIDDDEAQAKLGAPKPKPQCAGASVMPKPWVVSPKIAAMPMMRWPPPSVRCLRRAVTSTA